MNAKKCKAIRRQFRLAGIGIKAEPKFRAGGVKSDPASKRLVGYMGTCDAGEGRRQYQQAKDLLKKVRLA